MKKQESCTLLKPYLKEEDENVLWGVESLLNRNESKTGAKKTFKDFAGIWTEEEAEKMKKDIEEACGQIHPDDWK